LTDTLEAELFPDWFTAFLHDRQTREPSAHTMKAYRQDFAAIAGRVTNRNPTGMKLVDITNESMRAAFAAYAQDHEAASIRRCWSTWNVLCTFLYTGEQLAANPMQLVGRPKLGKALPKALPRSAVETLLETVAQDRDSKRQTDWVESDLAIILTALLAGLRSDELRQANVGDIRTTDDGAAVIHVKGKGGKERSVPSKPNFSRSLGPTSKVASSAFPDPKHAGQQQGLASCGGPRVPRCLWAATANALPREHCNRA
jgi:site-specific recombinase XerC